MRIVGGSSWFVETTLGEIKSNDDVAGACYQLSLALATAELVLLALASPRSATPASSPVAEAQPEATTEAFAAQGTAGGGVASCAASAAPLPSPTFADGLHEGLDYLLVGLIFAAKAAARRAPGRGCDHDPLIRFVAPQKVRVSLAG